MSFSMRVWRQGLLPLLALVVSVPVLAQTPVAVQPIDVPGAFPESMTVGREGALIFGALSGNHLLRTTAEGQVVPWINVPGHGVSIYGVLADVPRNTLWTCIVRRRDGDLSTSLNRYALDSGVYVSATLFPGRGRCNDISVGADGLVYATDIEAGRLFKLAPETGALTLLLEGDQFKGIDGIAWLGGVLYANNFRTGALLRVQLPAADDGSPAVLVDQQLSRPLHKPDGMRVTADGGLLIAEGSGQLSLLRPCGVDCFDVNTVADGLDGPTGVSTRDGVAWIVEARLRERAAVAQGALAPSGFTARGYCISASCP